MKQAHMYYGNIYKINMQLNYLWSDGFVLVGGFDSELLKVRVDHEHVL